MGTNAEFEPFEYVGDDGETLMGFDIDYAKYLCATMGNDPEIENMDFDACPACKAARWTSWPPASPSPRRSSRSWTSPTSTTRLPRRSWC